MRPGNYLETFFLLKITLYKVKQIVNTLVLMRFGMPLIAHTTKTIFIAFQIFDLDALITDFL